MPTESKSYADAPPSEAAPETRPGRRPGRRRVTPPEWDRFAEITGMEGHYTRRTVIKRFHCARAVAVLSEAGADRFAYLLGDPNPRWEVLAELGQVEGDEALVDAATAICKRRLKVKEAVALLRRCRTGRSRPGRTDELMLEVARAIDDYRLRHPGTTGEQVRSALTLVMQAGDA